MTREVIGIGFRVVCVCIGLACLWFEQVESRADSDDVDLEDRRERLMAERQQALQRKAAPPIEETAWDDDEPRKPKRADAALADADDDRPREMRFINFLAEKLWSMPALALMACGAFGALVPGALLLPVAIMRGAYLRYYQAGNGNRFMVGANMQRLIGQQAIVVWAPTRAQPGRVRMVNPVFKNSVIDCISDETIKRGMPVQVLGIDCGLLKVAPTPSQKKV